MFSTPSWKENSFCNQREMTSGWKKITQSSYLNILYEKNSKNYNSYSVLLTIWVQRGCGESKSLIITGTLSEKLYGMNSPNFIGKYYAGLLGCSRLFPNSLWKLLTFRNEHVDLGVKEEDMQKTEEMPTHNAAGN